jgi:hypothetical protein
LSQRFLLLLVGVVAFLWATRNWRKATQAALVLLVLEGAIRKWVFPGSQQLIYFAKDLLLIGCYAGFVQDRSRDRARVPLPPAFILLVGLTAAWAGLNVFNPRLPNILVGVLGFKAYFLYIPLIVLIPACFPDDRQLARFLARYALLAIPVGLLGLFQFASPASSELNTYARAGVGDAAYVATFGSSEHVRVTGTFSFISGYTSFLLAITILLLALLGSTGWRFRGHRALYLALALSLLGMLMSGSRGPVLILAILFPFYWYLAVLRERDMGGTVGRAILAIGVVAAGLWAFGGEALGAFLGRASGTSDVAGRLIAPFLTPWELLPRIGLFGYGTGSTHQTAAAVAPSIIPYSWLDGLLTEGETGKIMVELGPLGFILIYAFRLVLVVIAFGYAKSLRTRFHRSLATACFLFLFAQLFGSPVFEVTSGVYYWFFAGVMMLAVRLDRSIPLPAKVTVSSDGGGPRPQAVRHQPPPPLAPAWRTPIDRRS